jgi:hypothetical protein
MKLSMKFKKQRNVQQTKNNRKPLRQYKCHYNIQSENVLRNSDDIISTSEDVIDVISSASSNDSQEISSDEYVPNDMEEDNMEDDISTDLDNDALDGIIIRSSASFTHNQCFNHDIQEKLVNAINEIGFKEYFTEEFNGGHSPHYVTTWSRRLSRFLNFSYHAIHNTYLEADMIVKWTKDIIRIHYKEVFKKYVTHLRERLQLKPSTVLVELYDIKKYMDWFVYIRTESEGESAVCTATDCLKPLEYVLMNICKSERKRLKKQNSECQDLETLVELGQLPEGGLEEIQQCLQNDLQWVKSWAMDLMNNDISNFVGRTEYNRYMQILYASFYAYSPQGRISGIESMKLKQGYEMLTQKVAFSKNFKTNSTFGFQPVTTSSVTRKLLHIYMTYLRPNCSKGSEQSLFLHHNGSPATRIGDKVRA